MSSFNKVILMGNITRDIELRYTPKGTAVTELGIATNRRIKQGEEWVDETTFVDVTVWGSSAEFVEKYFRKGKAIFIEGRLQMDSWTDQQSGKQRYKLKVIGENVQFAGNGDSNPNTRSQSTGSAHAEADRQANRRNQRPPLNGDTIDTEAIHDDHDGDDIPF